MGVRLRPRLPFRFVMQRRRIVRVLLVLAIVVAFFVLRRPRSASLPLETITDGPPPSQATAILVFLHGRGVTIDREKPIIDRLRRAGLSATVTIVLLEGPFPSGLGRGWGDSAEEQADSRARIAARLDALLGDSGLSPSHVVIAGFSQGAGLAIDVAASDKRIGGLASFSPCLSMLRGELPKRDDLRILLAHGSNDRRCPVEESRSLARALEAANKKPRYIELEGDHTIPSEVLQALVTLVEQF